MARKKISYKIPPLRQMGLPGGLKQTGFAHEGIQGMTNYQQFATPETHTMGHMDRTTAGSQVQGSPTVHGVGPNSRYIDFKNFQPNTFVPTYIANTNPVNTQFQNQRLGPLGGAREYVDKTGVSKQTLMQNAINTGKPLVDNVKESVNTFSSEIDPADKTEFKNEVINDVMSNVNPPEMQAPQNKLEELYKPV